MNRKLTSAGVAAFAAFAVGPATASATSDPQLIDNKGKLVRPKRCS